MKKLLLLIILHFPLYSCSQINCLNIFVNPKDSLIYSDSLYTNKANCIYTTRSRLYSEGEDSLVWDIKKGVVRNEKYYFSNGVLAHNLYYDDEGKFINDSNVYFFNNGQVKRISYCENGKEVFYTEFDKKSGEIIYEYKKVSDDLILDINYDSYSGFMAYQGLIANEGYTYYYATNNNKISEIETFKNGGRHGLFVSFYENGLTKCIEGYINGKKNGWCFYYSENGELLNREYYEMGELR